jgi:hypothetical protein
MATTSTTAIQIGTTVRCAQRVDGKRVIRKAVVLGYVNGVNPSSGYGVWFYTQGDAGTGTLGLAFEYEITVVGSIRDMSERTLLHLERGGRNFSGAHELRLAVSALRIPMKIARRGY